jgi:hypothetical protein
MKVMGQDVLKDGGGSRVVDEPIMLDHDVAASAHRLMQPASRPAQRLRQEVEHTRHFSAYARRHWATSTLKHREQAIDNSIDGLVGNGVQVTPNRG